MGNVLGQLQQLYMIRILIQTILNSAYSHRITNRMLSSKSSTACADVFLVPMFTDNYGYILVDRETKASAVVDPAEPEPVMSYLHTIKCSPSMLLCTHKHEDHVGGNLAFKQRYPSLEVVGTKYEPIPAITKPVGEGDQFSLGSLTVSVIHTPCHTSGHIIFIVTGSLGSPIIFSGDTLFVGGCGRFFEGTADDMLANMDRLSQLPSDSLVYPAHEYTESNFKFLSSVDPETCLERYKAIQEIRKDGQPTVPSTIGAEKRYNLFMNCRDARVQSLVGENLPVATMALLRERKNSFK